MSDLSEVNSITTIDTLNTGYQDSLAEFDTDDDDDDDGATPRNLSRQSTITAENADGLPSERPQFPKPPLKTAFSRRQGQDTRQ